MMERMADSLRARLLTAVAGHPDGTAPYVLALAEGDDAGYFAEDSAPWIVHAGMGTFVAGIRALLLQALHPGAMAGVHDWSRYREDPIGRLAGTVRWIVTLTYGSRAQADRELGRVGRFHARVAGEYRTGSGESRTYSATDGDLVDWVHIAFADAFLTCHERWGGAIPGGADAYVREWATAGRLMGVDSPPESAAELRARLDGYLERMESLEKFVTEHTGVSRALAMSAGREVRVIVEPNEVDDDGAQQLARTIAEHISKEFSVPGEIKVTVIRELRAEAVAN